MVSQLLAIQWESKVKGVLQIEKVQDLVSMGILQSLKKLRDLQLLENTLEFSLVVEEGSSHYRKIHICLNLCFLCHLVLGLIMETINRLLEILLDKYLAHQIEIEIHFMIPV